MEKFEGDLGTDVDDAIQKSGVHPVFLKRFVHALQDIPYLENVKVEIDDSSEPCPICVEADYVLDSKKMPGALYPGLLELSGNPKCAEMDALRAARRMFAAVQGMTGYEFEGVRAEQEFGMFVASVELKRKDSSPDQALCERVCVYLGEKGFGG